MTTIVLMTSGQRISSQTRIIYVSGVLLFLMTHSNASARESPMRFPSQHYFVAHALELVDGGSDRLDILVALGSVARNPDTDRSTAAAAVRAAFAMASSDEEIRQQLLAVVADVNTGSDAHRAACQLLVYVQEAPVRAAMLQFLQRDLITSRWSSYFEFFRDTGDLAFLQWLEANPRDSKNAVIPAGIVRQQARYIRIQYNTEEMLRYIGSNDKDLDAAWVVRQAVRQGANKQDLAAAVTARLNGCRSEVGCLAENVEVLQAVRELALVSMVDPAAVATVQAVEKGMSGGDSRAWPMWATERIERRRDAFYGITRNDVPVEQPVRQTGE
jgi:hypothetical protein